MGSLGKRIKKSVGRRGLLLILAGTAWVLVGIQIVTRPRHRFSTGETDARLILTLMDGTAWGWLWCGCGIGAVLVGLFRKCRPFHGRDEIGFNLIVTPAIVWTLFFATSWGFYLSSDGTYGQSGASYGLVVWGLISAFIVTLAGWPEGDEYRNLVEGDAAGAPPTGPRHRATS